LQQAQAEIQQLQQTPAHVDARVPTYIPSGKPSPAGMVSAASK